MKTCFKTCNFALSNRTKVFNDKATAEEVTSPKKKIVFNY